MSINYNAYGDVNPIEHGGQWVRKVDGSDSEYDIVTLHALDSEDVDTLLLGMCLLDTKDAWIDKKSVADYADSSDDYSERFALDAISYYGIEDCGGSLESVTVLEVVQRLAAMNIFIKESLWDIPYLCGVCSESMKIKEFNSNDNIVMQCNCGHTETTNIDEFKNSEYWRY